MNAAKRTFLFEKQGGRCCWCKTGMQLDANPLSKKYASDEHLVPKALQKKFEKKHKQDPLKFRLLACRKCNTGRKCEIADQELLDLAARFADEWEQHKTNEQSTSNTDDPSLYHFLSYTSGGGTTCHRSEQTRMGS